MLEIFSYSFMVNAFIVGILIAICCALLGVVLVLKRYSMIGDGLSHVGFFALALAACAGVSATYSMELAIPIVVVAAVLILPRPFSVFITSRPKGTAHALRVPDGDGLLLSLT